MTMTFNISGNLAAEPRIEPFGENGVLARLRIASDRWTRDADGGRRTTPEFFDVALFGENAEQFRNAHTGDVVRISGDVRPTQYDKGGETRYGHNFVGRKAEWQSKDDARAARQQAKNAGSEVHTQEQYDREHAASR